MRHWIKRLALGSSLSPRPRVCRAHTILAHRLTSVVVLDNLMEERGTCQRTEASGQGRHIAAATRRQARAVDAQTVQLTRIATTFSVSTKTSWIHWRCPGCKFATALGYS